MDGHGALHTYIYVLYAHLHGRASCILCMDGWMRCITASERWEGKLR
jgi:hypothetical protein